MEKWMFSILLGLMLVIVAACGEDTTSESSNTEPMAIAVQTGEVELVFRKSSRYSIL